MKSRIFGLKENNMKLGFIVFFGFMSLFIGSANSWADMCQGVPTECYATAVEQADLSGCTTTGTTFYYYSERNSTHCDNVVKVTSCADCIRGSLSNGLYKGYQYDDDGSQGQCDVGPVYVCPGYQCEPCDTDTCIDDNDWSSDPDHAEYKIMVFRHCDCVQGCVENTHHSCADGYTGTYPNCTPPYCDNGEYGDPSTTGCSPCPDVEGAPTTSDSGNNDTVEKCCVAASAMGDATHTYTDENQNRYYLSGTCCAS